MAQFFISVTANKVELVLASREQSSRLTEGLNERQQDG